MNTILCLAALLGAPIVKEKPQQPSIVGEWLIESSIDRDGVERPWKTPVKYVFGEDGTWSIVRGDKVDQEFRYTRPETPVVGKPVPLNLDVGSTERPSSIAAIYTLDGDTLRLCSAMRAGDPRPAQMKPAEGSDQDLFILKRVKAKM